MAQLVPARWRQALADLRTDMQHAVERWLPTRKSDTQEHGREHLPVRWREAVGQLREEIAEAVERWLPGRRHERSGAGTWLPSVFLEAGPVIDVEETDDEVIVLAEMPGLEREDFAVEVTADRLVLRGEKRRELEERHAGYSYTERSFGAFARVVPLPCEVAAEKTTATYRNGLLRVSLPKTEWAKVKRVQVQVR